ncbi:hypothetical protein NDU88_010315 [Pleurodeles waltl]|uniref:Uncharacterized protein n=1 Tax=Pleurodeles waltl TaxID=8319 RepID=A0AAV7QZX6_PLEWA|nr:hypothetical protein NDU88_010315 [Pleurodeles waltl]
MSAAPALNSAAAREALRVICEAGRDDLIQPGVLSQAWVGLEHTRRAAASGVLAVILACSPPQQRVNKTANARCLGEQKRKIKKEMALTMPGSLGSEALLDVEMLLGRSCTPSLSGMRPVYEGWASKEHMAERGGDSLRAMADPPADIEWNEFRHGSVADKERLLGNVSKHSTQGKMPIFKSLFQRSDEVKADACLERELLPMRPVWGKVKELQLK